MPTEADKARIRILSLLRLAKANPNIHEAASAHAKAAELAKKAGWSVVGNNLIYKPNLRQLSEEEAKWRAFGYAKVGHPIRKTSESSAVYLIGGAECWIPNLYIKVIDGEYFAPKKYFGIPEPNLEEWKDPPNANLDR